MALRRQPLQPAEKVIFATKILVIPKRPRFPQRGEGSRACHPYTHPLVIPSRSQRSENVRRNLLFRESVPAPTLLSFRTRFSGEEPAFGIVWRGRLARDMAYALPASS